MNAIAPLQSYLLREHFERALKLVRHSIHEMELDVVGEFQLVEEDAGEGGWDVRQSRVILVSGPILDFEATALGRAAAVFFPLHVLMSGEAEGTRISVVNPNALFEGRLPAGASDPLDRLVARVMMALDSLAECTRAS